MTFAWGSDDSTLRELDPGVLQRRFNDSGIRTRYYTPAVHRAAFALPAYVEAAIAEHLPQGSVIGIDSSKEMVELARRRLAAAVAAALSMQVESARTGTSVTSSRKLPLSLISASAISAQDGAWSFGSGSNRAGSCR